MNKKDIKSIIEDRLKYISDNYFEQKFKNSFNFLNHDVAKLKRRYAVQLRVSFSNKQFF